MLTELTIRQFVEVLASDTPAPGGGSASALAGSVGIALTKMVASLTIGKEKYKEYSELMEKIVRDTSVLQEKLLQMIDQDAEAYTAVIAVYKMPKDTNEEKTVRKMAMQEAMKGATKVPFELMGCCLEALELAALAVGKSNTNAASDLGVASLILRAAVMGAWMSVLTNAREIIDQECVNEYKTKGSEIMEKALPLADQIYHDVLARI